MGGFASRIKIQVGERSVEVEGTEEFVLKQFERLGAYLAPAAGAGGPAAKADNHKPVAAAAPAPEAPAKEAQPALAAIPAAMQVTEAPAPPAPKARPAAAAAKAAAVPAVSPGADIAAIGAPPVEQLPAEESEKDKLVAAAKATNNFAHIILLFGLVEQRYGKGDISVQAFQEFCGQIGKKAPAWVDTLFLDHINRTGFLVTGTRRGAWRISPNGEAFVKEQILI